MRSVSLVLLASCLTVGFARGEAPSPSDKLGKKIETTLTDATGKSAPLASLLGKKATVVVFLSFECPNSTSYTPTLLELHKLYQAKGIEFLGVCENEMTADELKQKVAEFKFTFPIYLDQKQAIAGAFKAHVTPEAFVLDHHAILRYRGRIDNMFNARLKRSVKIDQHDLKNALEETLAGKDVQTPITVAVGCSIGGRELEVQKPTTLTYYKDIAPLLQTHCQACHRPGEVGPFALMTYKQAVNWAEDIKQYTVTRKMPPWKPTEGVSFHNDRRLSDEEIKKIVSWVEGGTPEGNKSDAPAPAKFTDGWMLGKPDLILTVNDDYNVGPSGPDNFRCFVLPTNLPEDKYIVGFEVKPGNPQIVHHTLNFWDITGKGKELEAAALKKASPTDRDRGPGYSSSMGLGFIPLNSPRPGIPPAGNFGGWAPGQLPRFLPEGTGYLLPKGADIILQVHYHRNGRPEKDRTQIGLFFAKKPVERPYQTINIGLRNPFLLYIPAGQEDYKAKGQMFVQQDCNLHSVMPHMHLIGKSVKVTMTEPGKQPVTLVDIPEWDYNWQETYWLKEPRKILAGTKLEIEAVFDNSTQNHNNPRNPPGPVMFGEQTTNEMLFGFFGVTHDEGKRVFVRPNPPKQDAPKSENPPPVKTESK
jgi:thiol-disulfide isomerase/thioredoxin